MMTRSSPPFASTTIVSKLLLANGPNSLQLMKTFTWLVPQEVTRITSQPSVPLISRDGPPLKVPMRTGGREEVVLVRLKLAAVATPAVEAVTLYGPAAPLAVAVTLARPLAPTAAVVLLRVALAPLAGAAKVIRPP